MEIKKIIREEIQGFEWAEKIKPTLLNKVIIFEPLIHYKEFDKVKELIQLYDKNVDIEGLKIDFSYIHHLLISLTGYVAYGGTNWADAHAHNQMIEEFRENIDWYISEGMPEDFQNPERINGRYFFDL
jgi:hypothetical protein